MWHSEGMSDDIRLLCMKPIRPVANGGFISKDFEWNVMSEGGMPWLWLLPESLEELGLTFKARERPLEKV